MPPSPTPTPAVHAQGRLSLRSPIRITPPPPPIVINANTGINGGDTGESWSVPRSPTVSELYSRQRYNRPQLASE